MHLAFASSRSLPAVSRGYRQEREDVELMTRGCAADGWPCLTSSVNAGLGSGCRGANLVVVRRLARTRDVGRSTRDATGSDRSLVAVPVPASATRVFDATRSWCPSRRMPTGPLLGAARP